jgi:hypothetical protein
VPAYLPHTAEAENFIPCLQEVIHTDSFTVKSSVPALIASRKYHFETLARRPAKINFPFLMAQPQN